MLDALLEVCTLVFVATSMSGVGLGVTRRELLRPLGHWRLLGATLVANFVIVPAAAWLLAQFLAEPLAIGLILVGAAAGSPFALKLGRIAEADVGLALSLVALLVVGTVIFVPIVLPPALPGARVSAEAVVWHLGMQLLLPLGVGMLLHWQYPGLAAAVQPHVLRLSNVALVLLLTLVAILHTGTIVALFGSGAILAALVLILLGLGAGWALGGPGRERRATLAFATSHRNYAAALVVATSDFPQLPGVLVVVVAASTVSLLTNFLAAGALRRRKNRAPPVGPELPA